MGKRLVLTIAMGESYQRMATLTHPSIKSYADKVGSEFVCINERKISNTSPHFEKFQIFNLLNSYDRVMFMDTDLIIRPDCPDLFDEVPVDKLGAFNEGAFADRASAMRDIIRQTGCDDEEDWIEKWSGRYYNSGVMIMSRRHKFLFEKPATEVHNFFEQSLLNLRMARSRTMMHDLNYKFNRMTCMDRRTGEPRHASYIIHYAGFPGRQDDLLDIISKDMARWRSDAPKYEYKRNVLIKVHGGLGDEVCAEPVVRHIVGKAFHDANVSVETWFPRLFEHIPVPKFQMGKFKPLPDQPYYLMETLVSPGKPIWNFLSVNLSHNTDFASISCLRKTLPDDEKQPMLMVKPQDETEVMEAMRGTLPDDLVTVHPGKGWESKTFPAKFWDDVLREITVRDIKVAVIGKYVSNEQGIVGVTLPDGVIDLRNLLSLGGLIALLSRSPVLVSNDSAPVHVASAFDNHIILIPSCKHPDHVLHVRKGRRTHKAIALYKKLTCEAICSNPTEVHGQTIDHVVGDIDEYLPEPRVVADAVASALNSSAQETT